MVVGSDHGAEMDQFRECIAQFETKVTRDEVVNDSTVVEYINGEGDPPFIKYRLTLEPIAAYSKEEYAEVETVNTETISV